MTGETQIMEMDKPISKTVVAIKRIDYYYSARLRVKGSN